MKPLRLNKAINAKEVRLIDEEGNQKGIVDTSSALSYAEEKDLDLVEISPQANPPVARIMDYGKYKYEQTKKEQEHRLKNKPKEVKTVRISLKIAENDYNIKMSHARRFLGEGHKVKVSLMFKGREITHKELGAAMLAKAKGSLADVGAVEDEGSQGREIFAVLAPSKK